jgi:hypothetical protein
MACACYFCGRDLKPDDAWFEVCDMETAPYRAKTIRCVNPEGGLAEGVEYRGALAYPGSGPWKVQSGMWSGWERALLFAHTACGPDIGYNFKFADYVAAEAKWVAHLREKDWWWCNLPGQIECALIMMKMRSVPNRRPLR